MEKDAQEHVHAGLGAMMPLIGQVMSHVRSQVSCACEEAGYKLTPEEAGTLMIIYDLDGLSQSYLAKILGKDRASITRLMNALVKSGLVGRVQDRDDRRVIRAHITAEGKQAFVDIFPALMALSDQALNGVSEQEFRVTQKVMSRIISNLCHLTGRSDHRYER